MDRASIRGQFPGLRDDEIFLDNAGGSQVPRAVVDRIRDYMIHSYVQLGADYPTALRATETVDRARAFTSMALPRLPVKVPNTLPD